MRMITIELDDETADLIEKSASSKGTTVASYIASIARREGMSQSQKALTDLWELSDRKGWGKNFDGGAIVSTDDEMYLR